MQAAFGVCHIPRSHTDITVGGVKLCGIHTDFSGNFACCGRHDLHQPLRAHAGLRAHDETAFLTNQAVNPRRIDIGILRVADYSVFKWRNVAQCVVEFMVGAFCAVDRHVVKLMVERGLCGGQQVVLIEAACGKTPFRLSLTAHFCIAGRLAVLEQYQCAFDWTVFRHAADVVCVGIGNIVARINFPTQLFPCQYGIKISTCCGCLFIEFCCLLQVAQRSMAACQPVEPGRALLQFFGHMRDNGSQFVPTSGTHGGTGVPFDLVVGQLSAVGNFAVIV